MPIVQTALRVKQQAQAAYTIAVAVCEACERFYGYYKRVRAFLNDGQQARESWSLTLNENTHLFDLAQMWLLELPTQTVLRDWQVSRSHDEITFTYGGSTWLDVTFGEHQLRWRVSNPDDERETRPNFQRPRLVVVAENKTGLEAVKDHLVSMSETEEIRQRDPDVFVLNTYGWRRLETPLRPLDTIVLAEGEKERICADLERFLNAEDEYITRGIPWHRGYLLYGPPGTGKTSLVKGLCDKYRLDLHVMSIGDLKGDAGLSERLREVTAESLILLEDVDSVTAATQRETSENSKDRVSAAGLLTMLDGLSTPHGAVTILTSNDPDRLVPALLRPGRIDLRMHLGFCTNWQVNELFTQFYGAAPRTPFVLSAGVDITPADITGVCKEALHDPETAEARLRALLLTPILEPLSTNGFHDLNLTDQTTRSGS